MQEDMKLDMKLEEETCVMVTSDDLELVPKEIANLKANKVHALLSLSLPKLVYIHL